MCGARITKAVGESHLLQAAFSEQGPALGRPSRCRTPGCLQQRFSACATFQLQVLTSQTALQYSVPFFSFRISGHCRNAGKGEGRETQKGVLSIACRIAWHSIANSLCLPTCQLQPSERGLEPSPAPSFPESCSPWLLRMQLESRSLSVPDSAVALSVQRATQLIPRDTPSMAGLDPEDMQRASLLRCDKPDSAHSARLRVTCC